MIPEAAVEAALSALYPNEPGEFARNVWESTIRTILEAAAPHMKAEARREAARELMDVSEHESRMPGIRFAVGFLGGQRKAT